MQVQQLRRRYRPSYPENDGRPESSGTLNRTQSARQYEGGTGH